MSCQQKLFEIDHVIDTLATKLEIFHSSIRPCLYFTARFQAFLSAIAIAVEWKWARNEDSNLVPWLCLCDTCRNIGCRCKEFLAWRSGFFTRRDVNWQRNGISRLGIEKECLLSWVCFVSLFLLGYPVE